METTATAGIVDYNTCYSPLFMSGEYVVGFILFPVLSFLIYKFIGTKDDNQQYCAVDVCFCQLSQLEVSKTTKMTFIICIQGFIIVLHFHFFISTFTNSNVI